MFTISMPIGRTKAYMKLKNKESSRLCLYLISIFKVIQGYIKSASMPWSPPHTERCCDRWAQRDLHINTAALEYSQQAQFQG